MNFVPECETFTSILVWIRLYSHTRDYWFPESLKTIGNKLGHFLKILEATLKGDIPPLPEYVWKWIYLEPCRKRSFQKYMMNNGCRHWTMRTYHSYAANAMNMDIYIEISLQSTRKIIKKPLVITPRNSPKLYLGDAREHYKLNKNVG